MGSCLDKRGHPGRFAIGETDQDVGLSRGGEGGPAQPRSAAIQSQRRGVCLGTITAICYFLYT